jgi:hypothetical protein
VEDDFDGLIELADTLTTVIDQYIDAHPDIAADKLAAVVSYVHGAIFRVASEVPASKLH